MNTTQTDSRSSLAARIREARRSAGLTQGGLAVLVGVTRHTVWCWEAGRTKPNRERLSRVALHCETGFPELEIPEPPRRERRAAARVPVPREERKRAVVGAVARHQAEQGYPPTLRDVQGETGFSSLSVVNFWLNRCEEAGLLVRARGIARAVTLTEAGRAFVDAPQESGGPAVMRREDPAPGAASAAGVADGTRDARRSPRREDPKAPARPGADAETTRRTEPASGVGARIREARRTVGLKQRELAALVGVSPHTIWCWEAGRTRPTYEHRAAVAFHCGTDVYELEGRTGPDRGLLEETAAVFRSAVAHLPERDIEMIWTFIRFVRWRRHKHRRAA